MLKLLSHAVIMSVILRFLGISRVAHGIIAQNRRLFSEKKKSFCAPGDHNFMVGILVSEENKQKTVFLS
jgi:hypothetical protein